MDSSFLEGLGPLLDARVSYGGPGVVLVRAEVSDVVRLGESLHRTADVFLGRLRQLPAGDPPAVSNPIAVIGDNTGRIHLWLHFAEGSDPQAAREEAHRRLRAALEGWRPDAEVEVLPDLTTSKPA